jgi:uncharacterized protein YaiL (DUF2058 family)
VFVLQMRLNVYTDCLPLVLTSLCAQITAAVAGDCDHTQARASEQTSALKAEVQAAQALATTAQTEAAAITLENIQLANTTQQQAQQAVAAKAQVQQLQLHFVAHVQVACVCFDTRFTTSTLLCSVVYLAY